MWIYLLETSVAYQKSKGEIEVSNQKAYCQCCGQKCTPEAYRRPVEEGEIPGQEAGIITDWRSPCCGDGLSSEPVTDQCCQCGKVAPRGEAFEQGIDGLYCLDCLAIYYVDRPDAPA